jgi:hypothetical protein
MVFDPNDTDDDSLKLGFDRGLIQPFSVLEHDGLRMGLFSLNGGFGHLCFVGTIHLY